MSDPTQEQIGKNGNKEFKKEQLEKTDDLHKTSMSDKTKDNSPLKSVFGAFEKNASSLSESPSERFVHSARPGLIDEASIHHESITQSKNKRKAKKKKEKNEKVVEVGLTPPVENSKPKRTRKQSTPRKRKPRVIYPYPCELCGKDVIEIKRRKL